MAKSKAKSPAPADPAGSAREHLEEVLAELRPLAEGGAYYATKVDDVPAGKKLLAADRDTQAAVVREALNRLAGLEPQIARYRAENGTLAPSQAGWKSLWLPRWMLLTTLKGLLRKNLPLTETDLVRLFEWPLTSADIFHLVWYPVAGMVGAAESFAEANGLSEPLRKTLAAAEQKLRKDTYEKEARKFAERLQVLLAGAPQVDLQPGEAWSDAALADLKTLKAKAGQAWNALFVHCQAGGKGKFTEKWAKEARPLVDAVGVDAFKDHVLRWFPLVDRPRTRPIPREHAWEPDHDNLLLAPHVELLRGLVWCCALREDADLARAVTRLALSAYRKIPGKGPRLVSLGNTCVTALGAMPGREPIGQLAILKVKVKFGTAQKEIEKAFNAAAARENLPRDEVEELAVPSYGLEDVGVLRETFGEYRAELLVDGSAAALHWSKDGKPIKSVPAPVKKDHAEAFKELQSSLKDVNAMLPAQRERIDSLFLARKTWPLGVWKERYPDHPLVGTIARRLIWDFAARGKTASGIWHDGQLVGRDGKPLALKDDTAVSLWHPISRPTDEVLAWRDQLERREVIQPFKQAHREVYLLTDAERRTRTYSNRFAAHVLRQHQFHALCAARGWKNKLRLMVDDTYPPAQRLLPQWNLRAEYWVEGAGSEYGRDTNESGVYLHLTTDQVRFYPIDAGQVLAHASGGGYTARRNATGDDEPVPLEEVPPLVLSEILRDVDLFVGVASVGNDPNWSDGGPGGQYRDYWQSYSFGELSATAQTRRTLLERLVPRLKIADRCSFTDRFLVVRGSKRTYKIHLGSGNILMEPNDQYLCIVPKQAVATAGAERVHLPFEGDGTLSIILSKAFLLADDAKITDPTITSQLGR